MPHIHNLIDFTVAAFIVHDHRVLLVDHREIGQWLSPGGHVELGEDTDQALLREIREETGFTLSDIEILAERPVVESGTAKSLYRPHWVTIHRINDQHRHLVLAYLVRAKSDQVHLDADEHNAIRWFSAAELDDPELRILADVRFYAHEAIRLIP